MTSEAKKKKDNHTRTSSQVGGGRFKLDGREPRDLRKRGGEAFCQQQIRSHGLLSGDGGIVRNSLWGVGKGGPKKGLITRNDSSGSAGFWE